MSATEQGIRLKASAGKSAAGRFHARRIAADQASKALVSAGFQVRTIYFAGRHTVDASMFAPGTVLLMMPGQLPKSPAPVVSGLRSSAHRKSKIAIRKSKGGAA